MHEKRQTIGNPSPLRSSGESIRDQIPYGIRGHHLFLYARLIRKPGTASKIAKEQASGFNRELQFMKKRPSSYKEGCAEYVEDVIGTNGTERFEYQERKHDALASFEMLPNDYPIEITEGARDRICTACIVGSHCTLKNNMVTGVQPSVDHDIQRVNELLAEVKKLGLDQEVTVSPAVAQFSDADDMQVRVVKMNAGTLRTIFRYSKLFDWRTYRGAELRKETRLTRLLDIFRI